MDNLLSSQEVQWRDEIYRGKLLWKKIEENIDLPLGHS